MGRRGRSERTVVPEADFQSYYGRPVIKSPVWKVPDVPAYLYLGGMAGASATMAVFADFTGRPRLCRVGRVASASGATASVLALVHDLGRPARFLNMLRVFKPTSPLSVGSWILAPFSGLVAAGAASEITGWLPGMGGLAATAGGFIAPAMTTYTAVLLSDTAVPGWHEMHRELPYVFGASAVVSAGAVGLLFTPKAEAAPARRMVLAGAAWELVAAHRMESRAGMVGEVYRQGRAGTALRAAKILTGVGAVASWFAGRSRAAAVASGVCLTVAGVATRYGIFEGGRESARDPRYTVIPQRERLDARQR
jgi:formate-dependent nitrite reductase membrane component NrfD